MNAASGREPPPDPATPATMLIVAEGVLVRIAAANYLRGCGFAVPEAVDADEAEALVASRPFWPSSARACLSSLSGAALWTWLGRAR